MHSIIDYFKNVRIEMTHVVWPNPRQAVVHVVIIVLLSALAALLIAGLDYVFTGVANYLASH